jgi:hypothetical protein
MQLVNDERGFLDIYLMGIFLIGSIIMFSVLLATAAVCRQNAIASYSCFTEAADFAIHTAMMNDIYAANDEDSSQVETYFTDSFDNVAQTTYSDNAFTPQSGSPFPGNIQMNTLAPYSQGSALPNGTTASEDGFWISLSVPVLVGNVPLVGQTSVPVTMNYFAEL